MASLIFDADDTLWENNVLFERVVEAYLDYVAHPTLDRVAVRLVLDEVERGNIPLHGYGSASFRRSLHDCFARLRGRPAIAAETSEIDVLAAVLAFDEVELIAGVADTLTELGSRHDLLLLTKGDQVEQQRKIDASNLAHHFGSVHIVAEKAPQTYRTLVADLGLVPESTWMIGNSPRSDILPARAAGLHAVFIPNRHTWVLEHDELDLADDRVLHLRHFRELAQYF